MKLDEFLRVLDNSGLDVQRLGGFRLVGSLRRPVAVFSNGDECEAGVRLTDAASASEEPLQTFPRILEYLGVQYTSADDPLVTFSLERLAVDAIGLDGPGESTPLHLCGVSELPRGGNAYVRKWEAPLSVLRKVLEWLEARRDLEFTGRTNEQLAKARVRFAKTIEMHERDIRKGRKVKVS